MRTLSLALACLLSLSLLAPAAHAIDAVRGKSYPLTPKHGPWMIMVASFHSVPEDRQKEGLTPEQAAEETVFELRQLGVPAYIHNGVPINRFGQTDEGNGDEVVTKDRLGRETRRKYATKKFNPNNAMISVLAGNYESVDDKTGQKTLAAIKTFRPKFMKDQKSGAIFREADKKGPFSGAFMTINPMLSAEQIAAANRDPVLLSLNSNLRHGLVEAKGKFTLQIATFAGRSVTPVGNSNYKGSSGIAKFEKELVDAKKTNLNTAGEDAEQLTVALRQKGIEAYTYHDHYLSVVCVGAFDSPNDPRIAQFTKIFAARMKPNEQGQEVLVSEVLTLPGGTDKSPAKTWIFDPTPQVVAIPRLR